jgi:hypothetical protein
MDFTLKALHMTDIFQKVLERERVVREEGNN